MNNTGNPLPSDDARDFRDNAQVFDNLLHSTGPVLDRFGTPRKTFPQMTADVAALIASGGSGGGSGANLTGAAVFLATDFGVVGGATVDETNHLNTALAAVGAAGGGTLIVRSANGTNPIYLNGMVSIETDNTTLKFESDIYYGAAGAVRISGGLAETLRPGQTETIKLRANSYTDTNGYMVLPVRTGTAAFLQVGDSITIRGLNDVNGKVLEKQTTSVKSIAADEVTCTDAPDYSFKAVYPDSAWPDDHTTGTSISISVSTAMTANVKGTDTIPVVSTTGWAVGDLAYIADTRTEADFMAPVVTTLLSAANMEILRVAAVDATANTLRMERAVRREYLTAWSASVTKMQAVMNSHIILRNAKWTAMQASRNTHATAINYGAHCSVRIAGVMEGSGGRLGIGVRVGYGYDCHVLGSHVYQAAGYDSGQGYGIALYYSTLCTVGEQCHSAGNRHNYLIQTCTSCDVTDCVSNDDYISGIDLHGANSVDCRIMYNRIGRSKSYAPGVTNGGGIRNGNTSHTTGDHNTLIAYNYIEGYSDTLCAAIDVSPSSRGVVVRDNHTIDSQVGFRHYKVSSDISVSQYSDRVVLERNTYTRVVKPYDINNYTNSFISELVLIDEKTIQCSAHFLVKAVPKVTMTRCGVYAPLAAAGAYAFDIQGVANFKAYDCYAGEAARGFNIKNCTTAKLVGNHLGDTTEGIGVTDAGGNGTLINLQNTDTPAGGSGSAVKMTKIMGTLAAKVTSTDPVILDNASPVATAGLTAVAGTVAVTVGSVIDVYAVAPYVSINTTGPAVAHLFADGNWIATATDRLTGGTTSENTGGKDFTLVATFVATEASMDLVLKIGPNVNTNTIMMNSKFNGLSQPYLIVKEFLQ